LTNDGGSLVRMTPISIYIQGGTVLGVRTVAGVVTTSRTATRPARDLGDSLTRG